MAISNSASNADSSREGISSSLALISLCCGVVLSLSGFWRTERWTLRSFDLFRVRLRSERNLKGGQLTWSDLGLERVESRL